MLNYHTPIFITKRVTVAAVLFFKIVILCIYFFPPFVCTSCLESDDLTPASCTSRLVD